MRRTGVITLLFLVIITGSCGDDKKNDLSGDFDRAAMLVHFADQMIIPAYDRTLEAAATLHSGIELLSGSGQVTAEQLINVQSAWKTLAFSWQSACSYNFGPAAESGLKKTLNEEVATFPVSVSKIENYIIAGDTTFNNFDRDSRGIFALEYLLFDKDLTNEQIVEKFRNSVPRKNYLRACYNHVYGSLSKVRHEWGSYRTDFISNTGTDIGSSVSLLYNEFLKSYEALKNFKFGIPLGRRPGQVAPEPAKVEAYYSGYSTELAREHWKNVQHIWEGQPANGADGIGFREYLEHAEGGMELITLTRQQVVNTDARFTALPQSPLAAAITQQFETVDDVHDEMLKLTRFYKSDLSSLIGIAITYSSGDGD